MKARYFIQLVMLSALWGASFILTRVAAPQLGPNVSAGLRSLGTTSASGPAKTAKVAAASFKQYREKDGQFYFKLVDAKGALLLQSLGFASPKEAGGAIAQIKQDGLAALDALRGQLAEGHASPDALQAALDGMASEQA